MERDRALFDVDWWTFDLVREKLVEAVALWRRSPGNGPSPFAGDGPWNLMLREDAAGDYDARGGFDVSSDVAVRPLPLNATEVAQRDAVSEWMAFIPAAADRRLVVLVCGYYARGYKQVPWQRVMRRCGMVRGQHGLRKRFERAVGAIAKGLNAAENCS